MDPQVLKKVLESEMVGGSPTSIPRFTGLSIDSRTIQPGEVFFAIVGDNNDGHDYVGAAFEQGAAAAVVSRSHVDRFSGSTPSRLLFVVRDTHDALLNLAGYIRRRTDARFAAVTGSNGKTTTKEMFHSIVSVSHAVYRSPGNLNNLYGLPISLGRMPDDIKFAIFELGISVPGEMTRLASVIKPELAVITNIGPAHLETLKDTNTVLKAKFELVDNLPVGSTVVLNADDPLLVDEAARRNLDYVGFGIENECRFRATEVAVGTAGGVAFTVDGRRIEIPVFGRVNVYNALAALAASSVWGCPPDDWQTGLADFRAVDMRLAIEDFAGLHLLIDCYNANPASVAASLRSLRDFETPGRKIAVLGDMLELGAASRELHRAAGQTAARSELEYLLCLGPESKEMATGAVAEGMDKARVMHFTTHQDMLNRLLEIIARDDVILFKGSRGMELEKIIFGVKGSAFKNN